VSLTSLDILQQHPAKRFVEH